MAPEPKRRGMKPVSECIRNWSQALALEVETWPGTTLKSAFGMTLVYRRGVVFAALPRTRALYEEDAILLKFMREPADLAARIEAEKRFAAGTMTGKGGRSGEGQRWRIFLMREDADVHSAIEWLAQAYRAAGRGGKPAR